MGLRAPAILDALETVALSVSHIEAVTLFESRQSGGSLQYVPLITTALQAE
jgi:hypothetical protein